MKRYGLQIGDIGVEFVSRDERQKAMISFTSGCCIKISDSGIRYVDAKGAFSTYERDDKEVLVNCECCHAVFGIEVCPNRQYPIKYSYQKEFDMRDGHICDACFENQRKAKELFDAQKIVASAKVE